MKKQNVLEMAEAVTPTKLGGWQENSEKWGPRTQPKRGEGVKKSTGPLDLHNELHRSASLGHKATAKNRQNSVAGCLPTVCKKLGLILNIT